MCSEIPSTQTLEATTPDTAREVRVRAIRPTDADALERFYGELSADARRDRFFSFCAGVDHAHACAFSTTDHEHREGFVAVIDEDGTGERIVGHVCMEPADADRVELAVAVADEIQHHGIGRRCVMAALDWARDEGFTSVTATMFARNTAICRLLLGLGLPARARWTPDDVVEVTIDLAPRRAAA